MKCIGNYPIFTFNEPRSYVVKGNFPKYVPPVGKACIQNKLDENIEKKLSMGKTGKNFMRDNIKKSSNSPRRDRNPSPDREDSPPKESQRSRM